MPLPDSYLDYLQANTTQLERFGDRFTTVDERVDYMVRQIDALAGVREPEVMTTSQIRFQETLAPLTGDTFIEKCPWPAVCTSILLHFPPGCNGLVDVMIGHSNTQVCPRQGHVSLDAATPVIPIFELVGEGEPIWVTIANADAANPHTITIILTLQRRQA